jgi:hypothetical protein
MPAWKNRLATYGTETVTYLLLGRWELVAKSGYEVFVRELGPMR